ncbi:methanol dehydrogenase regulatory protein [Haloferax elongans ATCC BAA-1513]|uniref:Methanol dehydrogenase regulatory protein n=1 Tax=Haloferax elongans ATCC BAA-1513 TaxID=1230453 RepID=M0HQ45_HALEO|nr:methanol dehydrogenase regulatory protein [Haloferax elongans ATCC BAA-1513]
MSDEQDWNWDTPDDTDVQTGTDTSAASGGALSEMSLEDLQSSVAAVKSEVGKRIIGQHEVVERLLVCILCDGNALLESNPGLGKTTLVRALTEATDLQFSRIQNTPDLMPSDITGTEIIRETSDGREFVFERGPIFANVVLADEINRATPKTQAALLEAMQEKQVTAAGETYQLPKPFFVLATQNPIDQGGTYPLPEAQTDRFLMKILVTYPEFDEERTIVQQYAEGGTVPEVERVLPRKHLMAAQQLVRQVPIADDIRDRAIELVRKTRNDDAIEFGASPRASMALVLAAKARAFIHGRTHVSWEDVAEMAPPVIRHRIILDFRAEREGLTPDDAIQRLIE